MHRVDGSGEPNEARRARRSRPAPGASGRASRSSSDARLLGRLRLPGPSGRAGPGGGGSSTAICRAVGIVPGSPACASRPAAPGGGRHRGRLEHAPVGQLSRRTEFGAAVAQGCLACHGERGIAPIPRTRTSPGSPPWHLQAAPRLQERQARPRHHDPDRAGLEEQQIVDVAAHFAAASGSPRPDHAEVGDPDVVQLVERGDPARACPPATRATASTPAVRSRRRPWRGKTGTTSPRNCAPTRAAGAAATSSHACATSPASSPTARSIASPSLLRHHPAGVTINLRPDMGSPYRRSGIVRALLLF